MTKAQNIIVKVVDVILGLVILFSVIVLLSVVMTKSGDAPSIMGYSVMRVLTGSMEPTIPTDSIVVVKEVDAESIQIGDVITYYSSDPSLNGSLNTHRVIEIEDSDYGLYFTTQGDANPIPDSYQVPEYSVVGVVVWHNLLLGKAAHALSNPLVFFPMIVVPFALIIIINLMTAVDAAKLISEEDRPDPYEQAIRLTNQFIHQSHLKHREWYPDEPEDEEDTDETSIEEKSAEEVSTEELSSEEFSSEEVPSEELSSEEVTNGAILTGREEEPEPEEGWLDEEDPVEEAEEAEEADPAVVQEETKEAEPAAVEEQLEEVETTTTQEPAVEAEPTTVQESAVEAEPTTVQEPVEKDEPAVMASAPITIEKPVQKKDDWSDLTGGNDDWSKSGWTLDPEDDWR